MDIWTWDLGRRTLTRLTFDPAADSNPVWTADGRRIIYSSNGDAGYPNLFWQAADGTGAVEALVKSPHSQTRTAVTPDGTRVLVREIPNGGTADIVVMTLEPPRRAQLLVQTMFQERSAEISPDGRWIAYESTESGQPEIYVRPFPEEVNGGRWQVSTAGGRTPLWSRNGHELFFLSSDGYLMGVEVDAGPLWRNGAPARVLQNQYYQAAPGGARSFDISPDGRRFLMIKNSGADTTGPQNPIIFVQNWTEELKRLVPTN